MLAASAAFAVARPVFAEPSVTTLVVPFPPGGSTDALARTLQPGLQAALGRNVIVENKSGAAGSIGAAQVAKSAPDGSSFLVTFDSHAVIPAILERPPLNVETELVPVFLVGTAPYVIAANSDTPYRTFADVIAACKEKPGSVRYASVGIGTLGHLAMTVLAKKAGVEVTHVPYRGGGPAMNDVLGGHVDLIAGSAALITPQLGSDRIRAIMGEQDNPAFNQPLLKRFVNLMGLFPVGNLVRLNTDELAVVTAEHPSDPFRPQVKILTDRLGAPLEQPLLTNTWERNALGEHERAVVEAVDPESTGLDPLQYL